MCCETLTKYVSQCIEYAYGSDKVCRQRACSFLKQTSNRAPRKEMVRNLFLCGGIASPKIFLSGVGTRKWRGARFLIFFSRQKPERDRQYTISLFHSSPHFLPSSLLFSFLHLLYISSLTSTISFHSRHHLHQPFHPPSKSPLLYQ